MPHFAGLLKKFHFQELGLPKVELIYYLNLSCLGCFKFSIIVLPHGLRKQVNCSILCLNPLIFNKILLQMVINFLLFSLITCLNTSISLFVILGTIHTRLAKIHVTFICVGKWLAEGGLNFEVKSYLLKWAVVYSDQRLGSLDIKK